MKRRSVWTRRIVVFLALASLTAPQSTGVLASLFAGVKPRAAAQQRTKEEMTARLNELEDLIGGLKQQMRKGLRDASLRAQLDALMFEYDTLSAEMGGDRGRGSANSVGSSKKKKAKFAPQVAPGAPTGCTTTLTTATQ